MPDYVIEIQVPTATVSVHRIENERADQIPVRVETVKRLVRAKNEARAIAHVVQNTITARRATVDDAVACTKAGIELEVAE